MDLHDLEHNTRDGVHVASLAGSWLALVCGFGGLRDHDGRLSFAPRLPPAISKLSFAIRWRGSKVRVLATPDRASYSMDSADGDVVLQLRHHGEPFTLTAATPAELEIPLITPFTERPSQPAGRAPTPRAQTDPRD